MRKFVTGVVGAVVFATVMAGTAQAAGTAGPYKTIESCKVANKKMAAKTKVGACYKTAKGYYFKYA
jgi:hypothetical protein